MFEGLNAPNLILTLLEGLSQFLINWWWVILPFIFLQPFLYLWRWWRKEVWKSRIKVIVLEIKLPEEILKPIRAMEGVLSSLWALYDDPNWKEYWFEGKALLDFSLEIASIDGVPHFYMVFPEVFKDFFESSIYAQYPEAEISQVKDYTKMVPQDIPNKDWDLWACDMMVIKDDVFPLRTYKEFETEREAKEEKRVDPIANLLEAMGNLKEGEQLWIQFLVKPVTTKESKLDKKAEKVIQKIMGRTPPSGLEAFLPYAVRGTGRVLFTGEPLPEGKAAEEKLEFGALKLSPGEVEVVKKIQEKVAKYGFESIIRFIYLGRKDVFFKPNLKLALGYFNEFNTQNLNTIKPWGKTKTKISYFLINRRTYLRKRRIFRLYTKRRTPLDPRTGGTYILNTEELASLYHFPSRAVAPAPTVPRIPAKRGEAPPGLPTE